MAEAINWTAFRNQGVYGMPPPFELSRIPEMAKKVWSHPFAQKIRDGVSQASSAWWENVNPTKIRDKDTAWRIGLAVGLVESASFTFLLPGSGMIKGGVNFAVTQGAFIGARELDKRVNINVQPQLKSFFKGVSAGGAYFSLPLGALNEISFGAGPEAQLPDIAQAPSAARDRVAGLGIDRTPEISVTPGETPPAVPTSQVPGVSSTETAPAPTAPVTEPVRPPVEAPEPPVDETRRVVESKIEQIQNNEDFGTSLAANVGEKLPIQDEIIEKVLSEKGQSIADLSPEALKTARKAVQTALENQVNTSADEALHSVIVANPDLDISSEQALDLAKKATKTHYEQWLVDAVSQEQLVQAAQGVLGEQVQVIPAAFAAKLTQFMAENQENSELFTEHIVAPGETAGHLVLRMGEDVKWDGSDWQAFAALKAINPDSFADLKTATGLSSEQFEALIKRIQNGDQEAYRELINKMGLIRAGSKMRLLTTEGMRRLLMSAKG